VPDFCKRFSSLE